MDKKIEELKLKLSQYDTKEILAWIATKFMTFTYNGRNVAETSDIFKKTNLMSPLKQYQYLVGLLISTPEPKIRKIGNKKEYEKIEEDIQSITVSYFNGFLPVGQESTSLSDFEKNKFLITASAFTSYFDMGDLRYEEQTEELIKKLYSQFDNEILSLTNLKIDDYLSFYHFIKDKVLENINKPREYKSILSQKGDEMTDDSIEIEKQLVDSIVQLLSVKIKDIYQYFDDEKASNLMKLFSIERKEREFKYYNEDNPFVKKPLCKSEGNVFVVSPQFLLSAIYSQLTELLEKQTGKFADKYKKKKAERVEELFMECLKKIFGDKAAYHQNVCEEPGTKEHDLLIEYNNYILIAEAKASKVREPLFNPEKAYKRICDHFNSDRGIGGGYKQAIILKKVIERSDSVTLFEQKTKPFTINNINRKKILPLVLTLNQFGELAINTSKLLEKEDSEPYPWVCNLHDFENIIKIQKYLNKTPDDFVNYILWRIKNHSRILSADELEILEQYYYNPKFADDIDDKTMIVTLPFGPDLIDKIYYEEHGIPYDDSVSNLQMPIRKKKIGVNEPCPCGSGKKFKKCCKGKGIYD